MTGENLQEPLLKNEKPKKGNTELRQVKINRRTKSKSLLFEKIINVIMEMNHHSAEMPKFKHSTYISGKLNHRYAYPANIFSAAKEITIQQFIFIWKIEKVKELLVYSELTPTEISYKLNYSSVLRSSA